MADEGMSDDRSFDLFAGPRPFVMWAEPRSFALDAGRRFEDMTQLVVIGCNLYPGCPLFPGCRDYPTLKAK